MASSKIFHSSLLNWRPGTPGLSLVGFLSSGLLSHMRLGLHVLLLGTEGLVGQGSGTKRPSTSPSPRMSIPTIMMMPRAKQLSMRGRARCVAVRRATWVSGKACKLLCGRLASTSPPTPTTHEVQRTEYVEAVFGVPCILSFVLLSS